MKLACGALGGKAGVTISAQSSAISYELNIYTAVSCSAGANGPNVALDAFEQSVQHAFDFQQLRAHGVVRVNRYEFEVPR
jgi:hypothetical protein